jgi:hypothetical protein
VSAPSRIVSQVARSLIVVVALNLILPALVQAEPSKLREMLDRADSHERSYEWDKAFAVYDEILKTNRDALGIRERQTNVLRRYWQEQRHKDIGYRKEVLSLEYAQALRVSATIFDTLLESSLPKAKLNAGVLLRKSIEELELALRDPNFVAAYLDRPRPAALAAFHDFLSKRKSDAEGLNRAACMKAIREIALAGQSALELNPTVTLLEMACGSCYAVDEFTAYLTPAQFRDLSDSVKPGPMAFPASVQFTQRSMDIGYIQITHFQETTPQEIDDAFLSLSKMGMKGLVVDLRGNAGGLVDAAVEVARRFLASGVIVSTVNSDPKLNAVYQSRNDSAWTVPVVVLVDGDTASAAEILAGALKENGRARILGQPTFGKGSMQGLVKLPEALGGIPTGGLRLTIARFFSPKGTPYAGHGITPDLLLEPFSSLTADVADPHIIAAHDDLMRQLAMARSQ